MSGYGNQPYGMGYYGTSLSPIPSADALAFAVGDRKVRIRLSSEPRHESNTGAGDALNPRTWAITEPETGKVYTVMSVAMVDAFTYDILTYEVFPNSFGELKLRTTTLVAISGIPFPTIEELFAGAYLAAASTNERKAASLGLGIKDLANGTF